MKQLIIYIIIIFISLNAYSQKDSIIVPISIDTLQNSYIVGIIIIDGKLPLYAYGTINSASTKDTIIPFEYIPGNFIINKSDYLHLKSYNKSQFLEITIIYSENVDFRKYNTTYYEHHILAEIIQGENFIFSITNYKRKKGKCYYFDCVTPLGIVQHPNFQTFSKRQFKKAKKVFYKKYTRVGEKIIKRY